MKETELDKAACLESYKRYTQKSTSVAFENGAKFGVKWLMKQSLSDRLTDKEKAKIKHTYETFVDELTDRFHLPAQERATAHASIASALVHIFGKDLFNN